MIIVFLIHYESNSIDVRDFKLTKFTSIQKMTYIRPFFGKLCIENVAAKIKLLRMNSFQMWILGIKGKSLLYGFVDYSNREFIDIFTKKIAIIPVY